MSWFLWGCVSESYGGLRCCVLAAAGVPPRSLQPAIHAEGHLRRDLQSLQALPRPRGTQLLPGQRPGSSHSLRVMLTSRLICQTSMFSASGITGASSGQHTLSAGLGRADLPADTQ